MEEKKILLKEVYKNLLSHAYAEKMIIYYQ